MSFLGVLGRRGRKEIGHTTTAAVTTQNKTHLTEMVSDILSVNWYL